MAGDPEDVANEIRAECRAIAESDRPFETKVEDLLSLGTSYLGVENGHLTTIDRDRNYWKAFQSTDSEAGRFPPGLTLDLETTYCRHTINREIPIAVHHAAEQGWSGDVAYQSHGLETYLGLPLVTFEEGEGTMCFVSEEPRPTPFTNRELRTLEYIGFTTSNLILQWRHAEQLDDRERLLNVINRILRHNMRNDLTVVRGCADALADRVNASDVHLPRKILAKVDGLVTRAEKIRTLQSVMTNSFERDSRDFVSIIESVVGDLRQRYPDATVRIGETPDVPIVLSSRLEIALFEVVENAIEHGGEPAHVEIGSRMRDNDIEITVIDDGRGIPEQELITVRDHTQETPLAHGSGVGLTLATMVIESHDGSVNIETSEEGSTVHIAVPVDPRQRTA